MNLVPRVFNECDGNVAEGWRQLGSNPGASDLFVCVVACPENAGVEGVPDNGGDVRGVDGALGGMLWAVSTNV